MTETATKKTLRPKSPPVADVRAAAEEMHAELARVDAKAAMLLALSGAATAVVASSPILVLDGPAGAAVRTGMVALVAAVVVLLLVARPRLKAAPFMKATEPDWKPESPRERLRALAGIARPKFLAIRIAVDLLIGAVVLISAGIVWEAL